MATHQDHHRPKRRSHPPRILGLPSRLRSRRPQRRSLLEQDRHRSRHLHHPTQLTDLITADTDYWSTLNPPMLDWVKRLQRAGIRTGILSNMPDAMEAGLRARHQWIESFDHQTWSHAVNLAKPELAIYRHAAEGLNTPPANILFIDDRAENIEAAIASGMQAIQYTNHDTFIRDMQARGFDSLLQLQRYPESQNGTI